MTEFKRGDKVVCISTQGSALLTLGKIYTVDCASNSYLLVEEVFHSHAYRPSQFYLIAEGAYANALASSPECASYITDISDLSAKLNSSIAPFPHEGKVNPHSMTSAPHPDQFVPPTAPFPSHIYTEAVSDEVVAIAGSKPLALGKTVGKTDAARPTEWRGVRPHHRAIAAVLRQSDLREESIVGWWGVRE